METIQIEDNPGFKAACRSTGYELENADFSSAALGGAMLCGDEAHRHLVLNHARFKSTDLRLAQCLQWKINQGRFEGSQCAGTTFRGCEFVDVAFRGVAYFDKDAPVMPTRFIQSQLLYADFMGEPLGSVVFKHCALRGAVFKDCDLRYARFLYCDLADANFEHASLDGINLHGSTLAPGQLSGAEANEWSTVGVAETGLTIAQLRGES